MATIDYRQRAERGAAFLDKKGPAGWRGRVDPSTLRQSSYWDCVLGQVYGDYDIALGELGIGSVSYNLTPYGLRRVRELGFQLSTGRDGYDVGSYDELTAAWRDVLGADES